MYILNSKGRTESKGRYYFLKFNIDGLFSVQEDVKMTVQSELKECRILFHLLSSAPLIPYSPLFFFVYLQRQDKAFCTGKKRGSAS